MLVTISLTENREEKREIDTERIELSTLKRNTTVKLNIENTALKIKTNKGCTIMNRKSTMISKQRTMIAIIFLIEKREERREMKKGLPMLSTVKTDINTL